MRQVEDLNKAAKATYKKMFGVVTPYNRAIKELEQILPQASKQMVANLPTIDWVPIR
mgnify:CR=1 FL=1